MVEHFITDFLQRSKCGFLREIVNVGVQVASLEDAILPQDGLSAEIQRNVEYLIVAFWSNVSQKTEIVFQMFNHVEHQHEIEEDIFLSAYICEFELKPLVRSHTAHFESLGRNLVSAEPAFAIRVLL